MTTNVSDVHGLLSLVRRVMPTIIANDIIGVSPMIGPASSIFLLRERYKNIYDMLKFTKDHYKHFLRVYNRRTYHSSDYLTGLGYAHVKVSRRDGINIDAEHWCIDNLKLGSYIRNKGDFWFAYNEDAVLFKMSWI